jgi:hypothetical protein
MVLGHLEKAESVLSKYEKYYQVLIVSTMGVIEKGNDVPKLCASHARTQKADTCDQALAQ